MRFTAAKETGDPHAHLRGAAHNPLLIRGKEIPEVPLQLPGDHILVQFLGSNAALPLPGDNYPLNLPVYLPAEHLFDQHNPSSSILPGETPGNSYHP